MTYRLIHGDCLDVMRSLDAGSVDAVVTDPPYALTSGKKGGTGVASVNLESPYGRARIGTGNGGGGFMGKAWDAALPTVEVWVEALRVAKPGAHLLAFGGTRTFHRLTCAIEDAGWEIRDCLSWLYGSGFPKSHNGPWGGTALKPAWEPIILARKPLVGTVAANVLAHGTGALNIDGCRIACADNPSIGRRAGSVAHLGRKRTWDKTDDTSPERYREERPGEELGRWPANVVLSHHEDCDLNGSCGPDCPVRLLDEQSGDGCGAFAPVRRGHPGESSGVYGDFAQKGDDGASFRGDSGGASRFFYTAKASRSEREAGLSSMAETTQAERTGRAPDSPGLHSTVRPNVEGGNPYAGGGSGRRRNGHPTVKPVDLMRWLVRLVTPVGGTVLDPFTGSGTTGVAAMEEGCHFVGIEREAEYVEIAEARLKHASRAPMLPLAAEPTLTSREAEAVAAQLAFDLGIPADEAKAVVTNAAAKGAKGLTL